MQSLARTLHRSSRAASSSSVTKNGSTSSLKARTYTSGSRYGNSSSLAAKWSTAFKNSRFYSTASPHPTPATNPEAVPILESLATPVDTASLKQEQMCLKLEDLVALPNTFAVVQIGGHQYKVTQGDQIMINRIDIPVQTQILLDKVLLLGSTEYTVIGQPLLPSAKVLATVEEHEKTDKVIIFKKRRRKTYQRKTGHREPYTLLRISDIMGAKKAPM